MTGFCTYVMASRFTCMEVYDVSCKYTRIVITCDDSEISIVCYNTRIHRSQK
jgi:hypothetical protein